jgi:RNA polymerase sigma-70 factor (ECF subfamily)
VPSEGFGDAARSRGADVGKLVRMDDESSQALLQRARSGDTRALEALLERHEAQIYRFGLKMCRDPEDAKDVLQDTLLAMARGVRDFRGASSISTWLYSIARSYCIKKRRKSKFAPTEERSLDTRTDAPDGALVDAEKDPEEALAGREVEHALQESIAALEPMYREVLLLRDVEGLTAAEVAEVVGINVAAVKSRLHRARLSVREQVAARLGTGQAIAPARTTCPDVLTLFSQHLEDEISAEVCEEMERHIATCDRCRAACDSLRRTLALCRTSSAGVEVPPRIQAAVKVALRQALTP